MISAVMSIFSDSSTSDDEKRQLQDSIHAALGQFAAHGEHWGRSSVLRQLGLERELVQDERERLCELNGEDSRMLATIAAAALDLWWP